MVPSTGIEPVTFPMSRERATAAPTGPKFSQIVFCWRVPNSGNVLYATSAAPTGLKTSQIVFCWRVPNSGNVLYTTSVAPTKRKPIFYYSIIAWPLAAGAGRLLKGKRNKIQTRVFTYRPPKKKLTASIRRLYSYFFRL